MRKYFGTDGIRAIAGEFPLVKDFVQKAAYCAAKELAARAPAGAEPLVIIGSDGRSSGPALLQYLADGIAEAGFTPVNLGIINTPAVSFITQHLNAVCGAVISASHNPAEFNGIKFFDRTGRKLDEETEEKIEHAIESLGEKAFKSARFATQEEYAITYIESIVSTVKPHAFKGLKIALDCANGAAYKTAPEAFRRLGAEVTVIGDKPDGHNINKNLGALHTEHLQRITKEKGCFCGFSFDGDGDRVIAADELGRQLDGDNIISSSAVLLKEGGNLPKNTVVLTVMANLSAVNFLKDRGINVELTGVGDKYVAQALEENGYALGGETSGHIIFKNYAPTGDGLLSAVQFLNLVIGSGKKASFYKDLWQPYPSVLKAVEVKTKPPLNELKEFSAAVKRAEAEFKGRGRVLARYSGTEPKMRLLVEGEDRALVIKTAEELERIYRIETGL